MSDLIDRQVAIDALDRLSLGETDAVKLAFRMSDYLKRLPSAQPERKTGRWIRHAIGHKNTPWGFDCSECGEWFVIDSKYICRYRYCPNCGAKMGVEHE